MRSWCEASYFPKDLPVAWGTPVNADSVFHPLDKVFASAPFTTPPTVPVPVVGKRDVPAETRGWLWSPQEDAKLGHSKAPASLSDIMKAEAARKKK